jgi:uncharacterized membrane protein YedE/YeeE
MQKLLALTAGLLFGIGRIAGGMTNPSKVQAFLDPLGFWDPSLAFVMGGAIAVAAIGFTFARRRERSWSGEPMMLPTDRKIDARLLVGGGLFGVGWGLGGLCPGPALTALGAGFVPAFWFVPAMLAGMWLYDRVIGPWLGRQL